MLRHLCEAICTRHPAGLHLRLEGADVGDKLRNLWTDTDTDERTGETTITTCRGAGCHFG